MACCAPRRNSNDTHVVQDLVTFPFTALPKLASSIDSTASGRYMGTVNALVGFHQSREDMKTIAVGRICLCIHEGFDVLQCRTVTAARFDRFRCLRLRQNFECGEGGRRVRQRVRAGPGMRPIRWTAHAVANLTDREIERDEAERTIAAPDRTVPGHGGRQVLLRKFHDASWGSRCYSVW